MTQLSNIKPDLEDLIQQLTGALSAKDAWVDLVESGTGQTLIEFMAGIGTMQNFNLERQIQELFTDTASLDSSIYTIARMLGVNPRRKVSATTTANISIPSALPGSITIPAYTQFKIEGNLFYNPSDIIFSAGQVTVNAVPLEQGEITVKSFTSDGSVFQEYVVGQNFTTNENLMRVSVNGDLYTRERRSLIKYTLSDKVFLEYTMADGSIRIVFGNGTFGTIPALGASISITYAISNGQDSNTASSGLTVSQVDTLSTIYGFIQSSGATTTGIVGGLSHRTADELRYTAPRLYASAGRAITRQDWEVICLDFPEVDVKDVLVYGEYELASTNNTLMNVVDCVLLPSTGLPLSPTEKTQFLTYIDDFKHVTTQVVIVDPVPVPVTVDMDVFYFDGFDPTSVQSEINDKITDLFAIKLKSLGKTHHLSDIIDLVKDTDGVDYVILNSPSSPIVLNREEFVSLGTVTITMAPTAR